LIGRLVGGGFAAVGREYGEDMPIPIPREHFAVPLREKRKAGPNDVGALVQLGYAMPNGYTGPVEWVDGDYDERTGQVLNVRPATSLDIEGAAPLHGPDRTSVACAGCWAVASWSALQSCDTTGWRLTACP